MELEFCPRCGVPITPTHTQTNPAKRIQRAADLGVDQCGPGSRRKIVRAALVVLLILTCPSVYFLYRHITPPVPDLQNSESDLLQPAPGVGKSAWQAILAGYEDLLSGTGAKGPAVSAPSAPAPSLAIPICPFCEGRKIVRCSHCDSTGVQETNMVRVCIDCGGTGKNTRERDYGPAYCLPCDGRGSIRASSSRVCISCNGQGWSTCTDCKGRGLLAAESR